MTRSARVTATGDRRIAAEVVLASHYLVLATADAEGRPWASPVYFAADQLRTFYWVSSTGSRHSRNIEQRPEVSLVVYDSGQPLGTGLAVYARAQAARVAHADTADMIATYSHWSEEDGAGPWDEARLTAAGLALYRADVTELSVLPGRGVDERVELEVELQPDATGPPLVAPPDRPADPPPNPPVT
jgi:nitroimidazol reductase NimA-like FMN-containing flavoprotein (pyridoxamine 5'-phosphate oxidase superfamily)